MMYLVRDMTFVASSASACCHPPAHCTENADRVCDRHFLHSTQGQFHNRALSQSTHTQFPKILDFLDRPLYTVNTHSNDRELVNPNKNTSSFVPLADP